MVKCLYGEKKIVCVQTAADLRNKNGFCRSNETSFGGYTTSF